MRVIARWYMFSKDHGERPMGILGYIVLAALGLLALFAAMNWAALTAPTVLSFFGAAVHAPLGLILLGAAVGFALLALVYAAFQRTAMLLEARRHAQALEAQRQIAETAEASRLAELREQIEREFAITRRTLEESANGLAAAIGELEEKLGRPRRDEGAGSIQGS
jgi:uncharacterized integral membrane protein